MMGYLGKTEPTMFKVEPCICVINTMLFMFWAIVFPEMTGPHIVISSFYKGCMILLYGLTFFISSSISFFLFGPRKENETIFAHCVVAVSGSLMFALCEMIISSFIIITVVVNNLDLSYEMRILIFGVSYPILKSIVHHFMEGAVLFMAKAASFPQERTNELLTMLNVLLEIMCNLGQMVCTNFILRQFALYFF